MIGRKTFATSTVVALIATGFIIAGCGDEAEDGGDGSTTGGVAGTPSGGTFTGGMGGTGPSGGTTSGGTSTGGSTSGTGGSLGGAAGSGGAGGGAAAMGPYACKGDVANCGVIDNFPATTSQTFGNAEFSGGVSVFGGLTRDMANTDALHVTGMVDGYGKGFNIWFTYCSTLQAYGGVEFKVSGTTMDAMAMNTIEFQAQTNSDYPWQPFIAENGVKGACTATDPEMAWSMCIAPGKTGIMLSDMPVQVMWADITGGMPTPWDAATSPSELVGIQWQFPWSEGRMAYAVDVTLDDVKFIGGTGPTAACPPYMSGGGGMGGMGGMAGGGAGGDAAGMAGAAGAGIAGAAGAGMAGAAGAGAGAGGRGAGGRSGGGMGGG